MKQTRKITMTTPALARDVAAFVGRSPAYITAAKATGYVFQYVRMTTARHFLAWLAKHPDFTVTAYVAAHSKAVRERIAKQQRKGNGHSQRRASSRRTAQ